MRDSSPELTILMPCLNEEKTLALCIDKAKGFLKFNKINGEIVIADNGSTDGSLDIALAKDVRVISVAEKGYGAALMGGVENAKGRYIIMADSDDSYDFMDLMPILTELRNGAELVVGNRFKGGIKKGAMPALNKYLGNPVLSFIGRLFFKIPLGDFHCGLRGFSREAILKLDLKTMGMEFASEMIVRAALSGLSIKEVPVALWPDGRGRKPHLSPWKDGWRHLRFLLLYSPRWLYLYPGLFMIGFGFLVLLLLLPGPLKLGENVGLDVHTLLAGTISIVMGTQAISFGLIARLYAKQSDMIPKPSPHDAWIENLKLEHFLLTGGGLLLSGIAGLVYSFHLWSATGFGALETQSIMRVMIFSTTAVITGLQIGFAGFMLGAMQIRRR